MRITIFGNHRRLASVAALGTLLCLTAAVPARAGFSDAVKAQTLSNGLRVLVLENHKAPVSTFNVFYRVGSRNEQFGKTGLSHLCEHLMFKGTKKVGPEEFSQIIQQNGGEDNAFTESDFTDYFETINKDHLDVPITLEADRMGNFAPNEMVRAAAYVAHPYHWPVIGWFHDVDGLTLADAMAYHKIYYSPQNALIVAVGDFDADQVLKLISEAFAGIKNGAKPPPLTDLEPPQNGTRRVELQHAANLPAFEEAYHVPNIVSPDAYALEIVSEILSDGQSSRLYKKLVVEKQMVVDIGAGYDMTSFDPGLFVVSAQMRPGVKASDTQAEVEKELAAMRDNPVGAEELQKAKNLEAAQFVFGQDSVMPEAEMLGVYEMLGDYHLVDKYLDGIDKVTAADVQRAAKTYLVASNMTEGVLVPTGVLPHGAGGLSGGELHHAPALGESAEVVR